MFSSRTALVGLLCPLVLAAVGQSAAAQTVYTWTGNGGNSNNWNTPRNWSNDTRPVSDISNSTVEFSLLSTTNFSNNNNIGALSLRGIQVFSPSGSISVSGTDTITLGVGGVDLSTATQNLTLATPIALGANQTWSVNSGRTLTVSGVVSGSSNLTKSGAGTLLLTGANTYSGSTTVNAGTLTLGNAPSNPIAGSLTSAVTVNTGGTLGGSGTVNGTLAVAGGTIAPGTSGTGTFSAGNTTLAGGSRYTFEINNATGTAGSSSGWDLLTGVNATRMLDITATAATPIQINVFSLQADQTPGLAANFVNTTSYTWKIADFDGGITGYSADKFVINTSGPNGNFQNALAGGTFSTSLGETNTALYLNFTPVPEPTTVLALAAAGLGGVGLVRRRLARVAPAR